MAAADIEQIKLTLARAQGVMDAYAQRTRPGEDGRLRLPLGEQVEEIQGVLAAVYNALKHLVDHVEAMSAQ